MHFNTASLLSLTELRKKYADEDSCYVHVDGVDITRSSGDSFPGLCLLYGGRQHHYQSSRVRTIIPLVLRKLVTYLDQIRALVPTST